MIMKEFKAEIEGEYRKAIYSDCLYYRYLLEIVWEPEKPLLQVIGLNPSTATERKDDPTLRRCKDFAKRWGCGGLLMTNLFAFRATDPKIMKATPPSQPHNDRNLEAIQEAAKRAKIVLAAWGNHGNHLGRDKAVRALGLPLKCLKLTEKAMPQHPLYVHSSTEYFDL